MNRELYNNFREEHTRKFIDDEEKIYNFNCTCGRLLQSIKNYEFRAKFKEEEHINDTLDCFRQMMKAYYELKNMGCELPKLTKLCKNTTYIKTLINA